MRIIKAEPRHLADIVKIEQAAFPDPWSRDLLERRITDPYTIFLIAEGEDGHLLAYAILQLIPPEAELLNIAVSEAARRSGIGRALLTALLEEAKSRGIDLIHLEVRASNHVAIALYETLGFTQTGLRRNYYETPCEDAILMAKPL